MVEEARSLAAHKAYFASQELNKDAESFFDSVRGFNMHAPAAGDDDLEDSKDYPASNEDGDSENDKEKGKKDKRKVKIKLFGINNAEANSGAVAGGEVISLLGPEVALLPKNVLRMLKQAGAIIETPVGAFGAAAYLTLKVDEMKSNNVLKWAAIATLNGGVDVEPDSRDFAAVLATDPFGLHDVSNKDDAEYIKFLAIGHALERQGYSATSNEDRERKKTDFPAMYNSPDIDSKTAPKFTVDDKKQDDGTGICKYPSIYSEDDFNAKKVSAKQRTQLEGIKIYGINPHNIKPDKGVLRINTELPGGESAARECFKNLTGVEAPQDMPDGFFPFTKPNGEVVVIRPLGDSGHPKVEINAKTTTKTLEKK